MKPFVTATVLALSCAIPVAAADYGPRIQSLLDMAPKERRAALKAMPKGERQGLWLQMKKAERVKKGLPLKQAVKTGGYAKAEVLRESADAGSASAKNAARFDQAVATRAVGTIQYDDGTGNTTFGGGAIIGNRFDTANGNPVQVSGTVSTVQAVVAQGPAFTTSSAGFVLLGPQTGGGGAFAIFSTFTGATGITDTITFANLGVNYTGSSFFVLFGDFANSYVPVFDTGSNGQGFHGVVGYTGGMGPNITSTFDFGETRNALIRATGNVVPVELTRFSVE
jgi:hypothetical protein